MKRYIKSSTAEYALNPDLNGIEIKFDTRPNQEVLDDLKTNGFRWHNKKKLWYAKQSPERLELANYYATEVDSLSDTIPDTVPTQKEEPVNQYGVKVGDLFYSSWGYEQTNITMLQVIELVGKTSVRVREVQPGVKSESNSGHMQRNISFKISNTLLPPKDWSTFIRDQENGDLKRIKMYNGEPYFRLDSFANAYPYNGQELYESWYY